MIFRLLDLSIYFDVWEHTQYSIKATYCRLQNFRFSLNLRIKRNLKKEEKKTCHTNDNRHLGMQKTKEVRIMKLLMTQI